MVRSTKPTETKYSDGSFLINKRRENFFRFEYKLFRLKIDNKGSKIVITEAIPNKFEIAIGFEGAGWIVVKLRSATREINKEKFYSK